MSRHFHIAWIFLAFTLAGCVTLHEDKSLYQEPPAPWEVEQNTSRLNDIDNLIQNGRNYVAKQQAEVINPAQLTLPQQSRYHLLYAQLLLGSGEAEQAINKLALVKPGQLNQADKIKFHQSQAFAYSLTGNTFETAKARIALDEFLTKPAERKNNQEVILESLGFLPQTALNAKQSQAPELAEWISAAKILASRNRNASEFNDALAKWRVANPKHAANFYLATVSRAPESIGALPDSIALLLPGSGPYADAAKAIRAGFMAAHQHYKNSQEGKPVLHFYDTEKAKSAELYTKAVQDGAKLVVGPLNKDNIKALANSSLLTIPVLALNHIPSVNKANLYQFALSPIDDAAEITRKAAAEGRKKALLLMPNNELGKRVGAYIGENWFAANGVVLDKQFYDPASNNFAEIVKKLLNANPANITADTLFLAASPKEGRAVNAALSNSNINALTVYALSNIYSGLTDQKNDASLNGVTFCDAPWLFSGAYNGDLNMLAVRDVWNKYPASYLRLIAMGIDAYVLAAKLPALASSNYAGATGNLSLAAGNRIKRELVCAKFMMGRPELVVNPGQSSTTISPPQSANDPIQVIIKGN